MRIHDKIKVVEIENLIPYVNNPKEHPENQIDKIASSIKNFGFTVPIVIDGGNEVIAGHGRLEAVKKLGLKKVPCIVRDDLTEAQIRAFRIADNKVAESEWNFELLEHEFGLIDFEVLPLELTGFEKEEVERIMGQGEIPEDEPEFDENIAEDVEMITCPECGHEFPR